MSTPTVPRLGPLGPFPNAPLAHPLDRKWLHYAFLSRCGRQARFYLFEDIALGVLAVLGPLLADHSPTDTAPSA
ncbi:hypothetical protein ABZ299_35555 [Streptomyces sp. NPDC006184]|uniref:hypothetical protein n=1 Tax=Streptomyces sp. NPDC006184 TaxID=3155455 RepID=UPI0033BD51C2